MKRSTITNNVWYKNMLVGNDAFSPVSFKLISTQLLTTSAASVTFSSIPQTYKHLQIRAVSRIDQDADGNAGLTLNGVTSASYFRHGLGANTAATFANGATSQSFIFLPLSAGSGIANNFAVSVIDILDYASTVKNKTVKSFGGRHSGSTFMSLQGGSIESTSALTSLSFAPFSANFVSGTRFSLYGIEG
jgi:hypothetical protein